MREVVVVGAGAAGLSAAWHLKTLAGPGDPPRVRLLEASSRPGGRLETEELAGCRVEWAAHGWTGASRFATDLALQLGLEAELLAARRSASRRYIYRSRRLHRVPGAILSGGLLSLPARLRLLAEPWMPRGPKGRDETVEQFASRRLGTEAGRILASAAMAGVFGGDSREISVAAAFPQLSEMEQQHGSLIRGAMAAAREARRGAPRPGPRAAMISFRGGMGRWGSALEASLPGVIQYGSAVKGLALDGSRMRVETDSEVFYADKVVLALGPGLAAGLIAPHSPEAAAALGSIPRASLAVVALAFPAGSFGGPADGYGFLVPRGEDLEVLGALWETNVFEDRAPEGTELVRVMIGGSRAPQLLERSDAGLVEIALRDLRRAAGLTGAPSGTWVRRQIGAIPQYTRGHLERVAAAEAALRSTPGIVLAGSGYRGVSVNACLEDGRRAAERCLERPGT